MAATAAADLALLPPLPTIEGPKLEAFTDDIENNDYELLEFLGAGAHSAVMRMRIDDNIYAVKFFRTHWLDKPEFEMDPIEEHYLMDRTPNFNAAVDDPQLQAVMDALVDQVTSFFSECRVYGRLKELDREDLAIKAHGYLRLYLTPKFQKQWNDAIAVYFPNDRAAQQSHEADAILEHYDLAQPAYAIVKDWVKDHRSPDGNPLPNPVKKRLIKQIPKMLHDLHQLHKCGIVIRDLKEQQYYEGKIGDFSHAWTIPHILAPGNGLRPAWAWKSMAAWDLRCFQKQIINPWIRVANRSQPPIKPPTLIAWRTVEHRYPTRSRQIVQEGPSLPLLKYDDNRNFDMINDPPFDPADFNWKALEAKKKAQGVVSGRVVKRRAAGQATGGKGAKKAKTKIKIVVKPRPGANP
ncbi:hypothetical protein ACHAO7_005540 [Fusarium culmorum]|uniref:Protein kinase domain-containing protein n=1 Tax=Fusarium culmorum TaxID=5516 RepID=A0A2T4H4Q0_FUSCU|nr:hypothetical protein FCULG_00011291 [Fusarium culmorum]